ncbi:MAG: DUF4258 domain-containing protein [Candidatus Asgardarchaeia archaeon]
MKIKFTKHALERIKGRKITIQEVYACIENSDSIDKDKISIVIL